MSLLIRRDATLRISGALHLGIFEQHAENDFFTNLLRLTASTTPDFNIGERTKTAMRTLRTLISKGASQVVMALNRSRMEASQTVNIVKIAK